MRYGFFRTLLAWLASAFAAGKSPDRRGAAYRDRQQLSPPIRNIVPSWFASQAVRADNQQRGAGDIRKRIDKAARNAVAVGFRRYNRLSATTPARAA